MFAEDPRAEWVARRGRAAGAGDRRLGRAGRRLRGRVRRSSARHDAAAAHAGGRARATKRSWPSADKALETNIEILKLDENNAQAIAALERLYLRDRALRRAARHLREEAARSRRDKDGAEGDPLQDRVDLRGRDQGRREGDRRLPGDPRRRRRRAAGATARSIASTSRPQQWKELADGHPARAVAGAAGRQRARSSS